MEWTMAVNEMLLDDITKLDSTLVPPGFHGNVHNIRAMQESLSRVINELGEQSAAAQGLNKVITSAEKLRNSTDHTLYLLKDAAGCRGRGEVISLLKMGQKHLFLTDPKDRICEVDALCVLDFFVLGGRQRQGYGRLLFNHMLQDTGLSVRQLAVDGPSPKMEMFLRKNFGVELLRQTNNFAVAPQFFDTCIESKSGRATPTCAPAASRAGRFSAAQPPSSIAMVIHGGAKIHRPIGDGGDPEVTVQWESEDDNEPIAAEPQPEAEPLQDLEERKRSPERPSTLSVESVASPTRPGRSPARSPTPGRESQLTKAGYFDMKFYHNKLW